MGDAQFDFRDVEDVNPGEQAMAYVRFLCPHDHVGKLAPGQEFHVIEGRRVVARGLVITLIGLEINAERARRKARERQPRSIEYISPRPKYRRKKTDKK